MAGSFIENVNLLASKLDIVESSNEIFDEGVIPVLEEIAALDLQEAILDLKKGNYLGNRKIDINLALNMEGITQDLIDRDPDAAEAIWTSTVGTVQYDKIIATFVDGEVIELPFLFDGNPVTVSTHGDLLAQLARLDYVYAEAQVDSIYQVTVGDNTDYIVTIDNEAFTYTSGVGATQSSIIAGIVNMINSLAIPITANVTDAGLKATLTADIAGNPFYATVSANLAINTINENVIEGPRETAFLAKLTNTLAANFASPVVGEIVRLYDLIGDNSNLERLQLHAVSGNYIEETPLYYWAKTTSAFQTLSMRANDIIKLGNEIDNIILLASSIEEVIEIQSRLPQLVDTYDVNGNPNGDETIFNNLDELMELHANLTQIITVYNDIKVGGTKHIETVSVNIDSVVNTSNDLNLGAASNIRRTGENILDIIAVADNEADIDTVAAAIVNVNTTAGSIANVNTVGTDIANVNTVATNITNVSTVANNTANINTVVADIVPNLVEILATDEQAQLAKDYAVKTAAAVEIGTYSAKEFAVGDMTLTGGSAKAWATDTASPDGTTTKSAKTWAGEAAGSAVSAAASAATATTKSNEIKNVSVGSTITGAAGTNASVVYNPTDGKFTFVVPQGVKGDRGEAFAVNAVGLFTSRSLYDSQIAGFSFLAIDTATIYFKLSNTSADWSLGAPFGKGDTGATGATGNGITQIAFTSTTHISGLAGQSGGSDTYTVSYTDSTTDTFTLYNGVDGAESLMESIESVVGAPAASHTITIPTTTGTFTVHVNGLKLASTDYTLTGTTVVVNVPVTAGDLVVVTKLHTFDVLDTYSQAVIDSKIVGERTNALELTNKTLDSITNTIGADHVHYKVRNNTGVAMPKGTVVKAAGTQPGTDYIVVEPTTSTTDVGIGVIHSLIDGTTEWVGLAINTGEVVEANTSAWPVGTVLYTGAAGSWTTVKPTTGTYQASGYVLRQHVAQGTILVEFSEPTKIYSEAVQAAGTLTKYVDNTTTTEFKIYIDNGNIVMEEL